MSNYNTPARSWDDFTGRIEEIIKRYTLGEPDYDIPELPGVDQAKKTYDAPTDEELDKTARDTYSGDFLKDKNRIASATEQKLNSIERTRKSKEDAFLAAAERAKVYFEKAREAEHSARLRQGLARSSIATLRDEELGKQESARDVELESGASAQMKELDDAIKAQESEREKALKELDVVHAAKITKALEKLKGDRAKKTDEVVKYNNELERKLQELAMKRTDWERKERARIDKEHATAQKEATAQKNAAIYNAAFEYLNTLSMQEARNKIRNDPFLYKNLSSQDYAKLYNYTYLRKA